MQLRCGGGAQDQVADDLGRSPTGQGVLGLEAAVFIAIHNTDFGNHVDSFFVVQLFVVREFLGAGIDRDERHHHGQRQHQRKELLHGFLLLDLAEITAIFVKTLVFRSARRTYRG